MDEQPGIIKPENPQSSQNTEAQQPSSNPTTRPAGYIAGLDEADLPKKLGEYQQGKGIVAGLGFIVLGVVFGMSIISKNRQMGIILMLALGIFGFILFLMSAVGLRQLRKARKKPTTFSQFQTDTATTYSTPLGPASVTNNETVDNWLGPIIRVDKGAIGYTVASKEVDKQAENTLLFTPTQVISLMLTPDDAGAMQQGALGNVASSLINYSGSDAGSKGTEFRMLHSKHWDQLITPLLQQPLSLILQNHLNYGISYANIRSVKVKNSLLNPGFVFHLNDGKKLRYAVMRKDRMNEIENYLQQKVRVES
jgi:hypothetical protein